MKRYLLILALLPVLASCAKYSHNRHAPQKDELQANTRIYGDFEQPARQSKIKYETPSDAIDRSAHIKDVMFGKDKNNSFQSNNSDGGSTSTTDSKAESGS